MKNRSRLFRLCILVLILSLPLSCNLPQLSNQTTQTTADLKNIPEVAVFEGLITESSAVSVAVGTQAAQIDMDTGASVLIPANAFPTENQLAVTEAVVGFDQVAPDVSAGRFYILDTEADVPVLGEPVVLSVGGFSGEVTAAQYLEGQWKTIPVDQGETVQVEITHFSKSTFAFFEWWSERDIELGETIDSMDNDNPTGRSRLHIEAGDENVQAFFGVNEQSERTSEELCAELLAMIQEYNQPKNREFPEIGAGYTGIDLAEFLAAGSSPSEVGGKFWDVTANSMEEIEARLLGTAEPLSPAEFLQIAIEANNGNLPLGILAAHNYLKELTYKGRVDFNFEDGLDPQYGAPAAHLQSWREGDNINAAGQYDKMGPLYHIFAAMTGGLWLPTAAAGPGIAAAEAFLRTFRIGGDRPDLEKAYADQCGIEASGWLRDNPPSASTTTYEVDPDILGESITLDVQVVSDLHGSYCDEMEGTFPYTWSVNVMQDTASGVYMGTIKFHNCPGGGRVLYHVVGDEVVNDIITLYGTKKEGVGGGELFNTSPDARTFYLDLKNGQLTDQPDP